MFLVSVTGTTTETTYGPELLDWTTAGSGIRRSIVPATRSSSGPTNIDEHEASGRSSDHRSVLGTTNDSFDVISEEAEITFTTSDSMKSRGTRLKPGFSISDTRSQNYETQKYKMRDENVLLSNYFENENARSKSRIKMSRNFHRNDDGSYSLFSTSLSTEADRSKLISNSDRSKILEKVWRTSSANDATEISSILSNRRTSRSVSSTISSSLSSLSSFVSSSLSSTDSSSNDLPASVTSDRLQSMETSLLPMASSYSKTTLGIWTSSAIDAQDTRTVELDQGFPNVGVELWNEETRKSGTADTVHSNLPMAAKDNLEVDITTTDPKLQKRNENAKTLAKRIKNQESNIEKIPFDRIITRSIPGDFNTLGTPENSKLPGTSPVGSGLTLAEDEVVELSTWHFDVPPTHSMYNKVYELNAGEKENSIINSRSDKFERRTSERFISERVPPTTTWPTTAVSFPKRYMRDAPETVCEKFEIGDPGKQEFYSPNYPQNYPPLVNCVRVLEGKLN